MATLALIPARGGSKGVPRKNLRSVGGRSLLQRAIDSALRVDGIDHVLVSTDDPEIADEARRWGAEAPFLRPPELASDTAGILPAIEHALNAFEQHVGSDIGTLVLLEPTSPFRTADHVSAAMRMFDRGVHASVVSVCPLERKPENIFRKTADSLERYIKDPQPGFVRRQDMQSLCRLNSAIYVASAAAVLSRRSLLIEPVGFIEMTGIESVNIDEETDLMLAEAVAARYGH
jgi:CMP-N-acetylneuraminic acid synthetase